MSIRRIFVYFSFCIISINCITAQSYVLDQLVSIVANQAIKQSDVENEYNQMIKGGYRGEGDLKCMITENMVKQKMLIHQAMLDSLPVSDAQIESELTQKLNANIAMIGSAEKLEQYFDKSMAEIKEDLRKSMHDMQLAGKMQNNIIGDVEITPSEVSDFYSTLPPDSIPYINAQIEIAQIAIYPPYSNESILEVKEKLLGFRKRIVNGENFKVIAGLYSEDPGTAVKGGEYGFATKGELDPDFAKAAFSLRTPGEVSRIVESQFGYHLIQLIERRGDRVNFRHILLKPKIAPDIAIKVKTTLDSIADLVRKDSITFDKAVRYYSMDEDTRFNKGLVVNPNTGSTKFDMDQLAPADYYVIKNLKPGEISKPYESRDTKGKVLYKIVTVESQIPPHKANLINDYNMIQQMAINSKKMTILENWFIGKRRSTYILLDDSFAKCDFTSQNWFKMQ